MDTTVVIVGAGPAGLMLACELGRAGVAAVVVERSGEPRAETPGVALNVSAVELLEQRGLLEPLRESSFTAPLPRAHFALLPLRPAAAGERYENSLIVSQDAVERVLDERARHLGVRVLRGHTVVGLDQDADGVEVTARHADDEVRLRAAFVVGCDGADSVVRSLAGIECAVREEPFYGLAGDIEVPLDRLQPGHLGAYYSPAGGVYMCLPVGPDAVRLITAEYGADTTGLPTAVTWEETRATVERLTGSPLPAARPRWMQRYRDRTVLADRYRQGRVLIAGDAAHTVFPLNGQALTTALHDVVNLGWKLAAVSRRQVPEELLDTYESERRPVALHVVDSIAAQVSLSKQPEQVRALRESLAGLIELDEVNRRLLDQVMGLGIAYDPHPAAAASMSPLVGRALPLLELKTSGTTVSLAELLRTGRGLLLDFSSGTAVTAAADAWSDRLDLVTAEPPSVLDARAVLLRPDGYVCWAWDSEPEGEASAGLRDALTHWFG